MKMLTEAKLRKLLEKAWRLGYATRDSLQSVKEMKLDVEYLMKKADQHDTESASQKRE